MELNKEILNRFFSGKYSVNDYLSVTGYFEHEENQDKLNKFMQDDWQDTQADIRHKARMKSLRERLHLRLFPGGIGHDSVAFRLPRMLTRIAAVLFIPAIITVVVLSYLYSERSTAEYAWAEIHSPAGSRIRFQLPDGTSGWLNGGSTIKYPVDFANNRNVEVTGEVWIDVVKQESGQFTVNTDFFDIRVEGTRFNVVAYKNEATAEVILEEGKVLVLDKNGESQATLLPDQRLIYEKNTGVFSQTAIDSRLYTHWKDGLLVFRNVTMREIARRLERRFNTRIVLHGDSLKSSIFRATFQDESLEEICEMLSAVTPIDYRIHPREKYDDDSFGTGMVEMWLREEKTVK